MAWASLCRVVLTAFASEPVETVDISYRFRRDIDRRYLDDRSELSA